MTDVLEISARADLLDGLVEAALKAGEAIWRVYHGEFEVIRKADESLVTAADHAAEAVILEALARLAPGVPVVAEEEAAAGRVPEISDRFFLVDPLDGTKEFIRRGNDFTVNIGLIEAGYPTLGVVYAPARSTLYVGDALTGRAWTAEREPGAQAGSAPKRLHVRAPEAPPVAVASKSHLNPETEAYLAACGAGERISIGSSLKFGLVAAGQADVYPRLSPTSEWDTAAGHAVLEAAGGRVLDIAGAPLRYGKPGFLNPGFLALGGDIAVPPLAGFMGPST